MFMCRRRARGSMDRQKEGRPGRRQNGSYSYHPLGWKSSTERLASGVCNCHTNNTHKPRAHMNVFSRRNCEPRANKTVYHVGIKPKGREDSVSAAVSPGVGKQSEGAGFFACHTVAPSTRRRATKPSHLLEGLTEILN